MKILVTGCCGFIGFHITKELLNNKIYKVFGIDNLNSYYDLKLKKNRLKIISSSKKFTFFKKDLFDKKKIEKIFKTKKFDIIIHLAAQAGVRYSIQNPNTYFKNNVVCFFNILELSKEYKVKHLIYASTSSVYGNVKEFPVKEKIDTNKPLSFYSATKKTNEIFAYSYSNIYRLRTTGLRFFTIYGPYGRPDMSLFKFVKNIFQNKSIELYNRGEHYRDFTYVDDVVKYVLGLIKTKIKNNKVVPFEIYNIGNGKPVYLKSFVNIIKKKLDLKVKIKNMPFQKGDVIKTHSDTKKIDKIINFKKTAVERGVENFIKWYKEYYSIK